VSAASSVGLWQKHVMAVDDVTKRMARITAALEAARIPFALVGGQAVALWVATKDPAAVRTTRDVDILVGRHNLAEVRKAALSTGMEYFEVLGVGMLLERDDPNPQRAVRLVWAAEKVRPEYALTSPDVTDVHVLEPGKPVVSLAGLVRMKLMANRDQDRVHLRDLIDVDLVGRDRVDGLPPELAARLNDLLTEMGR